jgi:hypothetical protein
MGNAGSPYTFQAKMSKLRMALEFMRTYLDDLLCITKANLDDFLYHVRCQVKQSQVWELPAQFIITNPWEALCVDIIGPCILKGKDGMEIDFMCLTMTDPASSWFEIVELRLTTDALIFMDTKGQKVIKQNNTKSPYFDKSSAMISNSE